MVIKGCRFLCGFARITTRSRRPTIGYITRGRGCRSTGWTVESGGFWTRSGLASWVDPSSTSGPASYPVEIWVEGVDRPGLFADVTGAISGVGANILSAAARRQPDGSATITSVFETHNLKELQEILNRIRQVKGINSVHRVFGRVR